MNQTHSHGMFVNTASSITDLTLGIGIVFWRFPSLFVCSMEISMILLFLLYLASCKDISVIL